MLKISILDTSLNTINFGLQPHLHDTNELTACVWKRYLNAWASSRLTLWHPRFSHMQNVMQIILISIGIARYSISHHKNTNRKGSHRDPPYIASIKSSKNASLQPQEKIITSYISVTGTFRNWMKVYYIHMLCCQFSNKSELIQIIVWRQNKLQAISWHQCWPKCVTPPYSSMCGAADHFQWKIVIQWAKCFNSSPPPWTEWPPFHRWHSNTF